MEIARHMVDLAAVAGSFATGVAAVATAFSARATAKSARLLYETNKQNERAQMAQTFLEISKQYNEVYHKRNYLLKTGRLWSKSSESHLKYADLANTPEWRELREVAACFELVGVLVKKGYIDREILFDMVLVDPPATPKSDEFTLWDYVEIFLRKAREHNPNQWVNWEYLVNEERKYYTKITRELKMTDAIYLHDDLAQMQTVYKRTDEELLSGPLNKTLLDGITIRETTAQSTIRAMRRGNAIAFGANIYSLEPRADHYGSGPDKRGLEFSVREQNAVYDKLATLDASLKIVRGKKSFSEALNKKGVLAMLKSVEGMDGWDGNLQILDLFKQIGILWLMPFWNTDNPRLGCGGSVKAEEDSGLTQEGRKFIRDVDNHGIILDISHASRKSAKDILDTVQNRPVIVSHAGYNEVTPHLRNIPKDIARKLGLFGVVFHKLFVGGDGPENVVDHIKKLFDDGIGGKVALGPDFNGITKSSLIPGLHNAAVAGRTLAKEMRKSGFTEQEIGNVFHGNAVRFLERYLPE
jgi:membrane dipeptidase